MDRPAGRLDPADRRRADGRRDGGRRDGGSSGRADPRRLGEDLDRVLAGLGAPPVAVLTQITDRWAELIGPEAAGVCRPLVVEHGRLVVAVDQRAWVSQLRWMEADVVRRIAELLGPGVVDRLEVRAGRPDRSRRSG